MDSKNILVLIHVLAVSVEGVRHMNTGMFQGGISNFNNETYKAYIQRLNEWHRGVYPKGVEPSAVKDPRMLWPGGKIPYVFTSAFDSGTQSIVMKAMEIYHSSTCIKFAPRANEENYITIKDDNMDQGKPYPGCWAAQGMVGGGQEVNLERGYCGLREVLHELMHAIGFWHEQCRLDRDDYVIVYDENIEPDDRQWYAKAEIPDMLLIGKYDMKSIMHYTSDSFQIQGKGPTMKAKNSGSTDFSGETLTTEDIDKIRLLYGCDGSSGCIDNRVDCNELAKSGECEKDPLINKVCYKSCHAAACGNQLSLEGRYQVKSRGSQKCLDIPSEEPLADGISLRHTECNRDASQQWTFERVTNNEYRIRNGQSLLYMDVKYEESGRNGGTIQQRILQVNPTQYFRLVEVSSGWYAIKSVLTGRNVCPEISQKENKIQQWDDVNGADVWQQWNLIPVQPSATRSWCGSLYVGENWQGNRLDMPDGYMVQELPSQWKDVFVSSKDDGNCTIVICTGVGFTGDCVRLIGDHPQFSPTHAKKIKAARCDCPRY